MRRERGNIILTALFIAIFLFFLSVALIWNNRQDIALSLSVEHKLKAQSATRTAAYEAYYRLRKFGELDGYATGTLDNGADYQVELVSLEPLAKRGEVLLVRARGISGPVTSYLTLHLRDTRIAGADNRGDSRVLFFPPAGTAADESDEEAENQQTSNGKALFGQFTLEEGGPGVEPGMEAREGPAFVSDRTTAEPPEFYDFIPVFVKPFLRTWGPVAVVSPELIDSTSLRVLTYSGNEFEWEEVDPPTDLGDPAPEGVTDTFVMGGSPDWSVSSVLAKNVWDGQEFKTMVFNIVWDEKDPPTLNAADIENPLQSTPEPVGTLIPWGSAGTAQTQQKFVTRGAIAPDRNSIYSHGWHFVYQPHDGSFPDEITEIDGSTLTKWPCVLKYTVDGKWEKAWTSLKEDGSVESEHRPDPGVLAVTSDGKLFSVNQPEEGEQRRLLTLDGTNTKLGDPVPSGQIIVYKDAPYLVSADPTRPPLMNLNGSGEDIDFQSLPDFLPEIHGEVVDTTGTEALILNIEGGYSGEPLNSTKKLTYTARPRYDFEYSIAPGSKIALDGTDLWAVVNINVIESEPTFEKGYLEPPFQEGPRTTLARYDGERWHILPNGLRTCLKSSVAAPGSGVVAAIYQGLPPQMSRYSIISVDTNPF